MNSFRSRECFITIKEYSTLSLFRRCHLLPFLLGLFVRLFFHSVQPFSVSFFTQSSTLFFFHCERVPPSPPSIHPIEWSTQHAEKTLNDWGNIGTQVEHSYGAHSLSLSLSLSLPFPLTQISSSLHLFFYLSFPLVFYTFSVPSMIVRSHFL